VHKPDLDFGDHVYPNPAAHDIVAQAVNLAIFTKGMK